MKKYVFKPYEPAYPKLFEEEKTRLEKFLDDDARVEHFGSTAVPELGGKGIIDIYITVPKEKVDAIRKVLEYDKYEFRPNAGSPERFFFRKIVKKNDDKQLYHVHLTDSDNPEFDRDISFRNYLRSHPDDANRYAKIKKKAATESEQDRDKYMRIKKPLILELLKKSLL